MSAAIALNKPAMEPHERAAAGARANGHWLNTPVSTQLLGVSVGPDVYLRNVYRVLGLPANAPPETVAKQAGRLKAMSRLSSASVGKIWIRNGYEHHISPEDALHAVRSEEHTSELQSLRHLVC